MLSEEEKKAIENLEELSHYCSLRAIDIEEENSDLWANFCVSIQKVENLIEKQNKIIDNAINEVEKVRQYFDDGLQPEFIGILEILKDKKVIDW